VFRNEQVALVREVMNQFNQTLLRFRKTYRIHARYGVTRGPQCQPENLPLHATPKAYYDNADRVVGIVSPAPGTGQPAQATTYAHDYAGRVTRVGLPDGGALTNLYSKTGELLTNYGSRVYPVAYAYDAQGRRTNMITWTNFAGRLGAAVTTWRLDGRRGFMTNQVYADGTGPTYTYTPAGRLRTRTWARDHRHLPDQRRGGYGGDHVFGRGHAERVLQPGPFGRAHEHRRG
jgi:hypothetical protein